MQIESIELKDFRNYEYMSLNLDERVNLLYGDNAQGKTNILEAIFLTSIGKSFRTSKDKELIKMGEDYATVEVEFSKSDRDGSIKIEISDKKNIFVNRSKNKKVK